MPSSLVTRMRACRRSAGGDLTCADVGAEAVTSLSAFRLLRSATDLLTSDFLPTMHIGTQGFGNRDRPVLLLVVLHDGDQCTPNGNAGAVQRVHEPRALLAGLAATRLHAPRLELAAIGAARDLAIGSLPRQPDFDII